MNKEYKISLDIYPESIINESLEAFKDVSIINFTVSLDTKMGILNIFGDNESEIEEIFKEFMNYNISLINE